MLPQIDAVLARNGGVADRRTLLRHVSRHQLDNDIRQGHLVSEFHRAWSRPWDRALVRHRAALISVGPPAALTGPTALHRRDALVDEPAEVHVAIPTARALRPQWGLAVHRVSAVPPQTRLQRLPTVTLPEAIVTSWGRADRDEVRAAAISAVRDQRCRPDDLRLALHRHSRLPDRAALHTLVDQLDAGCESELEIWGLLHVFDVPGLRHGSRQLCVTAAGRRYRVDLGFETERVIVELDGLAYHCSRSARERDMRRDAALAAAGWIVLRFSYRRLHDDVAGCRRDVLRVLAGRRSTLGTPQ